MFVSLLNANPGLNMALKTPIREQLRSAIGLMKTAPAHRKFGSHPHRKNLKYKPQHNKKKKLEARYFIKNNINDKQAWDYYYANYNYLIEFICTSNTMAMKLFPLHIFKQLLLKYHPRYFNLKAFI